jgi:Ca2+-binding RTX toxin-like protein
MVVDGSDEASGTLRLIGGAASDTLTGGGGDDQLFGGLGADQLTGNGGRTRSSTPRSLIPAGS